MKNLLKINLNTYSYLSFLKFVEVNNLKIFNINQINEYKYEFECSYLSYLKIKKKLVKPFSNLKRNINDKEHIYKKCKYCKTTLKLPLPSKRGIKTAKCPKCGKKVKVFTLKKEKIEIITNNKRIKKKSK